MAVVSEHRVAEDEAPAEQHVHLHQHLLTQDRRRSEGLALALMMIRSPLQLVLNDLNRHRNQQRAGDVAED